MSDFWTPDRITTALLFAFLVIPVMGGYVALWVRSER